MFSSTQLSIRCIFVYISSCTLFCFNQLPLLALLANYSNCLPFNSDYLLTTFWSDICLLAVNKSCCCNCFKCHFCVAIIFQCQSLEENKILLGRRTELTTKVVEFQFGEVLDQELRGLRTTITSYTNSREHRDKSHLF